jgi:hypothetical protein
MIRTTLASMALVAGLLTPAASAAAVDQSAQPAAQVTPADAAPFIGDWTMDLQGPNGPGTFDLTVKAEKEKVVADISVATMPAQAITDVTKADQSLVLSYTFNYEGNPVDAVVKLTPAPEGKTKAEIAFAQGAYIMTGTAAKKEKAK